MSPIKNTGDTILINAHAYTLGDLLGSGLEGSVYAMKEHPSKAIKIIDTSGMKSEEIEKAREHLRWLSHIGTERRNAKDDIVHRVAFPQILLDDELGYTMNRIKEGESLEGFLNPPQNATDDEFNTWYKQYSLKRRFQTIVDMFNLVRDIHINGLIFTDLSPRNILVGKETRGICLIDTDNMRNRTDEYVNTMGTPGYMAPEVWASIPEDECKKNHLDPTQFSIMGRLSPESDIYSLAAIAFELLTMEKPFIGDDVIKGTPDDEECAMRGLTDYILKPGTKNKRDSLFVNMFASITTKEIRDLFNRTFVDGLYMPALRPSDEEFYEAFSKALDHIGKCTNCGEYNIFESGTENICFNPGCMKPLKGKLALRVFLTFLDNPNKTMAASGVGAEGKINKTYLMSETIIEVGEEKMLYYRHFQESRDRGKPVGKIKVVDQDAHYAEISMKTGVFNGLTDPEFIGIKTRTIKAIPLEREPMRFNYSNIELGFGTVESNEGKIQIIGRIEVI